MKEDIIRRYEEAREMKLKDFFGRNIDVNCYIELWLGTHDDQGELLHRAYGYENDEFEPWFENHIKYITVDNKGAIILEI